jgi:hypothetical protein
MGYYFTMDEPRSPTPPLDFDTVPVRDRHDGWTPERQHAFIAALAESGCVDEACRTVGMSVQSAYRLRRHFDAQGFRLAWEAALDYAIRRLSDAVYARAIHGVAVPHYYKGEVVGEHRRYDERLAMFLLRYRDPLRYAKGWDTIEPMHGHEEIYAVRLARTMLHVESGDLDMPMPAPPPPGAEPDDDVDGEGEATPDVA